MSLAARHARHAARFADVVSGVTDWNASTPVAEWKASDVLDHLIDWSSEFFAADGIDIVALPDRAADRRAAWDHHAAQIQHLLDSDQADRDFTHPQLGTKPLAEVIDSFYTTDVFMHTWDLARATGQDDSLDASECANLLAGMEPIEDMLRSSGQFGSARVAVPADASIQDQLIGFIGRDPAWQASS